MSERTSKGNAARSCLDYSLNREHSKLKLLLFLDVELAFLLSIEKLPSL